jgi:Spy/CpxP family protein refolding chaperone
MKKMTIVIAALCVSLLGSGYVFGQSRFQSDGKPAFQGDELARMNPEGRGDRFDMGPGPGGPEGRMRLFGDMEKMRDWLKLSDEQISRISSVNLDYERRLLDYREKIDPLVIKLKKLLLEDQVDLNAVYDHLKRIGELQVEVRMLRIRQWLDIEKILTPEQRMRVKSERSRM